MYIIGPTAIKKSVSTAYVVDTLGSAAWTASGGSPTSQTTSLFLWTAPSSGNVTIRLTATVGGSVAIFDVYVAEDELTFVPSLAVEGTLDDVTLIHEMENGARRGRRKVPPRLSYELRFNNRDQTEYDAVVTLFNSVGKLTPFAMQDPITNANKAWYFDSAITRRLGGKASCSIDYSFRVKEA